MTSAEASVAIDPVAMLQDRLGIDEVQARDLANIAVACPMPGQDRQSSLGEFMASEHGVDKAASIIEIATQAKNEGVSPEEAVSRALGFSALRDRETGKLVRVEAIEAKKKPK